MSRQEVGRFSKTSENLEALKDRLRGLTNTELDEALEADGGVMMSDERFGVYKLEYMRRGLRMPQ